MTYISIKNVTKDFGIKTLFDGLSLVVDEYERLAVVGANGTGKSTLLKLMNGDDTPDSGEVVRRRGIVVGFVRQADVFNEDDTVLEALLRVNQISPNALEENRYRFEQLLDEAGFNDHATVVKELSGGWRKRLAIISALSLEPDLLLLDEPTNHLDIPGILWAEKIIENFSGAVVCISHDRYFIERTATRVVELDPRYPGGYLSSDGGYSAMIEKRSTYLEQLGSYRDSLANKVRREVQWLRQGVKARTTKARYRVDEAHRLVGELNSLQLDDQRAELGFAATGRKTKELIKAESISKSFGSRCLFREASFVLYPGTRLGIVGPNGCGKTTMLRTLMGEIQPDSGKIHRSSNLRVSYFGQKRQQLDQEKTLKECLASDGDAVVYEGRQIHVVTWAKRFLFRSDQLAHKVKSLSGGEQARVLLAQVALEATDLLIFDEPTNDLDIPTLEVLEHSFVEYPGAIVLVTHDRYLLDRVCTTVIGLPGDGRAIAFADYTQFEIEWDPSQYQSSLQTTQPVLEKKEVVGLSHQEKKELTSLERKIHALEGRLLELEKDMHKDDNAKSIEKLNNLLSLRKDLTHELETLSLRWETLEAKNASSKVKSNLG